MFYVPKRWSDWGRAIAAAAIGGFATSALTVVTASGAAMVGITVHAFDLKQALDMGLCGAFINVLMYLKQTPLPPPASGNTDFISKPPNQQNTNQGQ